MGYSKAPEQPQSSARPICHSRAMTSTGCDYGGRLWRGDYGGVTMEVGTTEGRLWRGDYGGAIMEGRLWRGNYGGVTMEG